MDLHKKDWNVKYICFETDRKKIKGMIGIEIIFGESKK